MSLLMHYFRYQFVPQMIFLNSLFGYLSLLIIVKWCTGSQADLYHVMIYMFLSPTDDLGENQLFFGQRFLQVRYFVFLCELKTISAYPVLHSVLSILPYPLADCVTITGTSCRTVDAVSKAISFEEATRGSMVRI